MVVFFSERDRERERGREREEVVLCTIRKYSLAWFSYLPGCGVIARLSSHFPTFKAITELKNAITQEPAYLSHSFSCLSSG